MDNYLEMRDDYLKSNYSARKALRSTTCTLKEYLLMSIIDKAIYFIGIVGLFIFGYGTENVSVAYVLMIILSIFGITLKLWCPRTVGMRIIGLIYVKNYDCLPIDKETAIMLYSYQKKYALKENKDSLSKYVSEGTHLGYQKKILPLYNELHQSRSMMVNGVYLAKLKTYNIFKEDYFKDGNVINLETDKDGKVSDESQTL